MKKHAKIFYIQILITCLTKDKAVQSIEKLDIPLLQTRMDTSAMEKVADVKLCLKLLREPFIRPTILSLGAGTGKVERQIAIDFPDATVVAIDLSLPMIEEIQRNAVLPDQQHNLHIVQGSIDRLPFALESFDLIVASSVGYEVTSFRDHGKLGIHTEHFYQQIARRLKPNGVFFLRDFVQPDWPDKPVDLHIGRIIESDDADPTVFVDRFSKDFTAIDLAYLRDQITKMQQNNRYGEHSVLNLPYSDAIEIGAHYSWAKRYPDEVKERYSYLPIAGQQVYIQENFRKVGVETEIIQHYTYLQPGYPQHVDGRLDIYRHGTNEPLFLSPFTGVMAFQRIK